MRSLAIFVLSIALFGAAGCRGVRYQPGQMMPSGKVAECDDWRTNAQACGEAIFNAPRVAKLSLGMSIDEARQVMERAPEERSLRTEEGRTVEVWGYLTNYDQSTMSVITFVGGKIVSIESARR